MQPHQTIEMAMAAVQNGSARAAMIDRIGAATVLLPGLVLSNPVTTEPYVVVARRSDAGLLAEIDSVIVALRNEGALAALDRKWLSPPAPAANLATPRPITPPR